HRSSRIHNHSPPFSNATAALHRESHAAMRNSLTPDPPSTQAALPSCHPYHHTGRCSYTPSPWYSTASPHTHHPCRPMLNEPQAFPTALSPSSYRAPEPIDEAYRSP